jgi:hypothetical protein
MAKRYKATRFSIQGFDTTHYQTTEQYARLVDELFDRATVEITKAAAKGTYNPDVPFSFADYPALNGLVQKVGNQLAARFKPSSNKGHAINGCLLARRMTASSSQSSTHPSCRKPNCARCKTETLMPFPHSKAARLTA